MNDSRREELFTQWLTEHRGIVVKVARSFTTNQADTDDLIQEILIRLWASIHQYRGDAKPSTWMYRVALNRAITWKRDTTRRRVDTPNHDAHRRQSLQNMMASTNAEDQFNLNRLYDQIRQLPEIDRALMLLSLDGLSYAEMSAITDLSESNVGARLSRSRTRLYALIEEDNQ